VDTVDAVEAKVNEMVKYFYKHQNEQESKWKGGE
jgi:hypothetical protein